MIDPLDITPFPGEPDALIEVRLRAELKVLRTLATQHENIEKYRETALRAWPGLYEAQEILSPDIQEWRRIRKPLTEWIKQRLLRTESYFIEKGWKLPKWKRPKWLLEVEKD